MKRKVVILTYTQHLYNVFMSGLKESLTEAGHDVIAVFQHGDPKDQTEKKADWCSFDMRAIELFNPDRIIVFNGFAKESFGAISYLKERYKVLYVERGWLPQASNIYLDSRGLGGRSMLAHTDLSKIGMLNRKVDTAVDNLRSEFYNTQGHPELGEYILVPLQLEHDTSIVLDSPYFKTMSSLLYFIKKSFPDEKVIVTPHPHAKDFEVPPGFIVERSKKTSDLAKTAKALIGINSTSLIEALVHHKPIGFLGKSVINASNVVYSPELTLNFPRNLLTRFKPNPQAINSTLFSLLNRQFNCKNPPDSVIKQIEV